MFVCLCVGTCIIPHTLVEQVHRRALLKETGLSMCCVSCRVLSHTGMLRCPESPQWLQSQRAAASAQTAAKTLWGPNAETELGAAPASAGIRVCVCVCARVVPSVPCMYRFHTARSLRICTCVCVCLYLRAFHPCVCVCVCVCAGKASENVGWLDLLSAKYRRGVIMGCMLFAIQQFAGINALVYFSTAVFRQVCVCVYVCVCVRAHTSTGHLYAHATIPRLRAHKHKQTTPVRTRYHHVPPSLQYTAHE